MFFLSGVDWQMYHLRFTGTSLMGTAALNHPPLVNLLVLLVRTEAALDYAGECRHLLSTHAHTQPKIRTEVLIQDTMQLCLRIPRRRPPPPAEHVRCSEEIRESLD